ncbi:MAG: hypothetical protein WD049_05070 [Candidatus Paceibacterota bacterium]
MTRVRNRFGLGVGLGAVICGALIIAPLTGCEASSKVLRSAARIVPGEEGRALREAARAAKEAETIGGELKEVNSELGLFEGTVAGGEQSPDSASPPTETATGTERFGTDAEAVVHLQAHGMGIDLAGFREVKQKLATRHPELSDPQLRTATVEEGMRYIASR